VSRRGATRGLLLTYLRTVDGPRTVKRIQQYMRQMHRISQGATTTALHRLASEGLIERVGRGEYTSAPPAELQTQPAALTTHYQE
jgi:DNA-binding HxlR family transcriptional regulator